MLETLTLYLKTFLHPWDSTPEVRKISYIEVLGISWALRFIYTFYSVFAIYLGVKSFDYFSTSEDFTHLVLNSFNFSFQKISLFIQLAMAILYPVIFHFTYKFWIFLLNFYANVFETETELRENAPEIINAMYTSNIFLIFPIAGSLISFFSQVYLLYQGVIKKLHFTKTQALLVLLTPLFLLFVIAILIVSYVIFLFSLF